jgi:hypothetical protein
MADEKTVRVAKPSEDELTLINALTPAERKAALVEAGRRKVEEAARRIRDAAGA